MEPEIIDWSSVESIFVEDFVYEHFNAPKWVDLSGPDEYVEDEAWFCTPNCRHPKCAEDYLKPTRNSKVKLLRSVSISEILPFRDRNRRNGNHKGKEINSSLAKEKSTSEKTNTKKLNSPHIIHEDNENNNPNTSVPPLSAKGSEQRITKPVLDEMKQQKDDDLHTDLPRMDRKPKLRNAFSARSLLGGRDILGQLTGFCSELKKLGQKKSKKGSSENVSQEKGLKGETARERERTPLLVVKEGTVHKCKT